MRRSDKEITDCGEIAAVMEKAAVCRIALTDSDYPYIIPVNFVVRDNYLYFHSSREGRKIDLLRKNNQATNSTQSHIDAFIIISPHCHHLPAGKMQKKIINQIINQCLKVI